ncbi:MgtC/SapB family protein [Aquibium sp. LZ166]|uniref:MgtC/SapB family protein n=1 Tax=Aquibium pacificus TaxID=3153579 RepID=A0ABV3SHZ6_9HYPH
MDPLILRLGLALAIGLLVGLERGWREREAPDRSRTAGIRTYGISGLTGGIFAALAQEFESSLILAAGFLGYGAVLAWFKAREATHDKDYSVTGVVAGLAVFALGALAVAGDYVAAAAGGTFLAAVLASREVLHGLLRRLTWVELRSALVLAVMTAIVLPILPDRTIDPWGGLNPREIWFFTVLTAAISFLGYAATRIFGATRGLLVSALTGAIVSSTAVTLALGRAAKAEAGTETGRYAGAACFAAMVSVLRVAVVTLIIEPGVLAHTGLPILAAAAIFAGAGTLLLTREASGAALEPANRNPFDIGPLLLFAILFAIVSTASAAIAGLIDDRGLIAVSAISGTFDVDVAVLSSLRLARQAVSLETVAIAVLLALAANALGRLIVAAVAGPVRYWMPLGVASIAAAAVGYGAFLLTPYLVRALFPAG